MKAVIFEDRSIQLTRSDIASEEFIKQIRKTVLGQEGQLQYHSDDAEVNATQLPDTSFLELRWKNRLIGGIALSEKGITIAGKKLSMLYVRYFNLTGLLHSHQGHVGKTKSASSNTIKNLIIQAFNHPQKLSGKSRMHGICAYVEDHNKPSLRNVEMTELSRVDTFTTWIYSRINPKKCLPIKQANPVTLEKLVYPLLDSFYSGYDLVPSWSSLTADSSRVYYYYEENGKILCGLSVEKKHWIIKQLPGRMDLLNKLILSHIPGVKNIFFTDRLNFLALEMVYLADGKEYLFPKLVESVLHKYKLHHAFVWTSIHSPLNEQIKRAGNYGLIQRLRKASTAGLFYKSFGPTLPSAPCYISAEGIS